MAETGSKASPLTATIASILLPGLGYCLIGQRWRGILTGSGIIGLFLLGIFFAGVRVVNVPAYEDGYHKYVEVMRVRDDANPIVGVREVAPDPGGRPRYAVKRQFPDGPHEEFTTQRPLGWEWILLQSPLSAIGDNLWFLGQVLVGPICVLTGCISIHVAQAGVDRSYGRLLDIGSLYTAVAGMLNLLVIIDTAARVRGKEQR